MNCGGWAGGVRCPTSRSMISFVLKYKSQYLHAFFVFQPRWAKSTLVVLALLGQLPPGYPLNNPYAHPFKNKTRQDLTPNLSTPLRTLQDVGKMEGWERGWELFSSLSFFPLFTATCDALTVKTGNESGVKILMEDKWYAAGWWNCLWVGWVGESNIELWMNLN